MQPVVAMPGSGGRFVSVVTRSQRTRHRHANAIEIHYT